MANGITFCRILLSVALLFLMPLSLPFYAVYLAAGLTDMIDGTVARRMHSVSAFGAKLDTTADLVFVAVCLYRLLPVFALPTWLWIWIAGIAGIKSINLLVGAVRRKTFVAVHSVLNKVTGALLFLLPLTLKIVDIRCSAALLCAVATVAAVREGYEILRQR